MQPRDFVATWSVIACEPLEILEHGANPLCRLRSWFKSKMPRKPALPHGGYLARALMHVRSFTAPNGEVTSKMRLRFCNLSTAAPDLGHEVVDTSRRR
jgi:hypothetical protein